MRKMSVCATVAALTLLCAANCFAQVTLYNDQGTWDSAVSNNYVTEPFDSGGLQSFTGVVTTNGLIGPARGFLTGSVWQDFVDPLDSSSSTTFSYLPGALIGAGSLWDTSPNGEGVGLILTLNLEGGGTLSVGQIGPIDGTFFGFTSTQPFNSFTITGGTNGVGIETFDMDNLQFASATPEPASFFLCLGGILLVGIKALWPR